MIAQNLVSGALSQGYTTRFVKASQMLNHLVECVRISRHDGHAFHGNVATCFSHRGHLFHSKWPGVTLKHIPQIRTAYSGI